MPKISIVVPIYNVEKYLRESIDCVLSQTFLDFELLLINDGSKDSSGKICDEYAAKDSRVRVIHKENGGLSSARNTGIELASGDYIIFLDPDDYWMGTNALCHLYEIAIQFNADVVRGEYVSIDEDGNNIITATKDKQDINLKLLDSATFYIRAIDGENFSWLFFFKREAIAHLRFDEERKFQEDIDFNIKFFSRQHKCIYTSEKFYVYRKRANSIVMSPKIDNLEGSFRLCDVFYKYSNIVSDDKLKELFRYNAIMMYYWTIETISLNPYYEQRYSIIEQLGLVERKNIILNWINECPKEMPILIRYSPYVVIEFLRIKNVILKYCVQCRKKIKELCDTL